MTDLKPCPFCGGTNLKSGGDDKIVGTWCLDCEATGPNQYGRHEWNDRDDRIEELEAACWRMKEERDSDKDRAKAAEANLAKAMQLIYDMFNDLDVEGCGCELCASYSKRLPELTGGKDE